MIIKCDKEGKAVIEQLFDIALKSGGMSNFQGIVDVMNIIDETTEDGDNETRDDSTNKK